MPAVWMDQGGTFTDVVAVGDDGRLAVTKVLSDRADLAALGAGAPEVRRGTTLATNALLEGNGAPVLLLTTAGFADLPWLGDQTRPDLFALHIVRPPPPCAGVIEVGGRIAADGVVLAPAAVDAVALEAWRARGVTAAAVVLVHGPLAPAEEDRLAEACRRAGFPQVSVGHEVAPSRGFLARLMTTLADASLSPLLPRASGLYMKSDGGLALEPSAANEWRGCQAVLSGPAGGVVAVAALAEAAGETRSFGLDMGGTSTDVCRIEGAPRRVDHLEVAGSRLRVPAVRLETVAAGGGSLLEVRGGVYSVGPRSAGADPGPAAYGRGGPATVTDAEAVLGRLAGFPSVCGPTRDQPLDIDAARAAVAALNPGRPVEEVALGFRRVAAVEMARAVRRLAASDGVDPASHALVAFGGAGPGHACGVARELGIRRVLVPWLAGVFSAVGIGLSRRRAERVAPVRGSLVAALVEARAALAFGGAQRAVAALRHVGTSELIEVDLAGLTDAELGGESPSGAVLARFAAAHRATFGFERPGLAVELVEVRVSVEEAASGPELADLAVPAGGVRGHARVWSDGWREVPVVGMADADGISGPALLTGAGTTVVVEPGWRVEVVPGGLLLVDDGELPRPLSTDYHPVHTAVLATRVMAVAEQMGERLARLARSVSIRERLDFSCAVFDAAGVLVANAPHMPVHLGAMGATVRALMAVHGDELAPGRVWASNDPYTGGSHLPDITVMQPVFCDDALVAFAACRGHHVDVGGISPGSMPPHATRIEQEGLLLRFHLLADQGRLRPPPLPGCRAPDEVHADLEAQVAACIAGERALLALVAEVGSDVFAAQLDHLQAHAARVVREVLGRLHGVHEAVEVLDDGTTIAVRLAVGADGSARVSVRAPAHPGNLNAPRAVAVAALLYAFRCLVDEPVPLNEGALRPFQLELEPGGLFDPQPPAAVAGGNVETSQRLVDALLRAVGALAASQGTMNNLTVGTSRGTWYETIGGGSGAGPGFDGADAVQVHMTNTRATDVEELETRFPVRLERWERRRESGGAGRWRGGDGTLKQWRFLEPASVALLAGRRSEGAPGLNNGRPGAPGRDLRDAGQGWEPAPAEWSARAGDRLRVETPGGGGCGSEG